MADPLVSVIVPVYNVEKYVRACLQSITEQTYKNLEIIVVDDGSTDGSKRIINGVSDRRITVISRENGGLSAARNTGIEAATGNYLYFVDSDDLVNLYAVEELVRVAESTGAKLVRAGLIEFASEEEILLAAKPETFEIETLGLEEAIFQLYQGDTIQEATVAWSKLYHRDLFADIRFPEGKIHEDVATVLDFVLAAGTETVLKTPLYFYRKNPVSIMKTPGWNHLDALVFYENHYRKLKPLNPELAWEALLAALKTAVSNAVEYWADEQKRKSQRYRQLLQHSQTIARRLPLENVRRSQDKALVVAVRTCPDTAIRLYGLALRTQN